MGTKAEILTVACAGCGLTSERTWTSHPLGWFVREIPNALQELVCSRTCLIRKEERYAAHDREVSAEVQT